MMAAAELAALRLKDLPSTNYRGLEIDHRDRVFRLLDKNGDGKISIEELMEVMEELGAQGEDAREMMQLLDSNRDGSLSSDEFDLFQKQVSTKTLGQMTIKTKFIIDFFNYFLLVYDWCLKKLMSKLAYPEAEENFSTAHIDILYMISLSLFGDIVL